MKSLISILIPVRDGAKYLGECLDSILEQDDDNFEVIIVENGSIDGTVQWLQKYADKDNRIRFYQNREVGTIPALQKAYAESNGELITRMDADDIMLPGRLSLMRTALAEAGTGHVALGLVEYFSSGVLGNGYIRYAEWLNGLTLTGNNFDDIYKECVIPSPCWMIHKVDFDLCGGFARNVYPEDYDLCFRFYRQGFRIAPVSQALLRWRDYPTRSSRSMAEYADNRFALLKMEYFFKIDFDGTKKLVLWGAGNKGKHYAKIIQRMRYDFQWVTNNPNKIGKDIYGVELLSDQELFDWGNIQLLIAVSAPDDLSEIKRRLIEAEIPSNQFFHLC